MAISMPKQILGPAWKTGNSYGEGAVKGIHLSGFTSSGSLYTSGSRPIARGKKSTRTPAAILLPSGMTSSEVAIFWSEGTAGCRRSTSYNTPFKYGIELAATDFRLGVSPPGKTWSTSSASLLWISGWVARTKNIHDKVQAVVSRPAKRKFRATSFKRTSLSEDFCASSALRKRDSKSWRSPLFESARAFATNCCAKRWHALFAFLNRR
mmetsp:Transcript_55072/g.128871  ORF Transcript_55072/g.128871 Transcript_55072/m.128871 type:complete len:209 (-) Transcript_55072:922-1548(-)